eukprot:TRINITY_DN794_c0_g2_i2.p3 TRINITY_DN794_c0_g2~~TRINITY_DN794_c0_g2_i2.p3  ORF type:complete len:211 (-),score=33.92 TRINITY_DN794_c0_g2_i2:34-666(-)
MLSQFRQRNIICMGAKYRRTSSSSMSQSKKRVVGPRTLNDFYFKKAKKMEYCARSAFKLLEMQEKYKLIQPGSSVLDLGSSPGAWLQVACQCLGPKEKGGIVLGIDIKEMVVPNDYCDSRVQVVKADVLKLSRQKLLACLEGSGGGGIDVVLSDMCHSMLGTGDADVWRSLALCEAAAKVAIGGNFLLNPGDMEQLSEEGRHKICLSRRS